MKRETSVWISIAGIPLFIALAPFVSAIHTHMMEAVVVLAAFFVLLSVISKSRFDAGLACLLAFIFLGSRLLFSETDTRTLAIRTAAITAFVFLNGVLLIGPWSRFSARVRDWYRHRRHLGVTTFFLALLHFALVFDGYYARSFSNAFLSFFTFFGFTALFLMFVLALTSFDWQQKYVGNTRWKRAHLAVLVVYLAIVAYATRENIVNDSPIASTHWVALGTFILFWFVVAPWGLAPRLMRFVNGWKQLHTLIHVGFASLVLHAWFGAVAVQPWSVKAPFMALVIFTWGSHLVGWIIKFRQDKQLKQRASESKQITVEGQEYWSVGRVDEFSEGKGKKFLVKNLPIAVFRYKEKFFGLFAICAHQKGPMEKGKIVNGYVECPWHRWQYSCETGQAPPGFHDRLAFYPCIVQDGTVYVSAYPKRSA